MSYPTDRRYTQEHEWARQDEDGVTVGITRYAQDSLGDVVYVELPKVGDKVDKGQSFGVVESTKAVSELYAPISGEIVAINEPLADAPETVNSDPHGEAWLVKFKPSAPAEFDALLTAEGYEKFLADSQ